MSAEGAGRSDCQGALDHLSEVREKQERCLRTVSSRGQCHSSLSKGQEGKTGKRQAGQPHLCASKAAEQRVLNAISKQLEEKKVIENGLHEFTKGKSLLTHLIAF